ncbi:hypothetical protein RvY_08560 [Ramazzottius varieornatus]|uniref:TraB domain-containing protein n=1 Tax=Ramazzottius varieornatus TaxID=947166 RepID=A0A1D1VBW5_RAMVA|nr:hypothetical protein RvY_08560 [Ramazzottius varieornatus]
MDTEEEHHKLVQIAEMGAVNEERGAGDGSDVGGSDYSDQDSSDDGPQEGGIPILQLNSGIHAPKVRPFNPELPDTVTLLSHPESNGQVYIVGTAHFGNKSQEDVASTIRQLRPDFVVLELCPERKGILTVDESAVQVDPSWEDLNQIIKRIGVSQGILQFFLLKLSAHCTSKLGMTPGGEMRCAYRESSMQQDCMILLGDRPLSITLKRAFGSLSLWQKAQFLWVVMREMKTDISQEDVEKCKSSDVLEELIEKLSQEFPTLHRVLVSERDLFLAHVLKSSASKHLMTTAGPQPAVVVGVVGIGHVPGIKRAWNNANMSKEQLNMLLAIPQPTTSQKIFTGVVRISILGLVGFGCYKVGRFAFERVDLTPVQHGFDKAVDAIRSKLQK